MRLRSKVNYGFSDTPEYRIWLGMRKRCENPNVKCWDRYGGRGIKVCERWLGYYGYVNFLADMGPRPTPKHSIDRINNDGNYEPGNCRWATPMEQSRNHYNTLRLTHNGLSLTLQEWADKLGVPLRRLTSRYQYGWSTERILTTEKLLRSGRDVYEAHGERATVDEWSAKLGMKRRTILERLSRMPVEQALTLPVPREPKVDRALPMGPPRQRHATVPLTHQGETLTMQEWSDRLGIPMDRMRRRHARGLSVERILSTDKDGVKMLEHNGERATIKQWADRLGMSEFALYGRLKMMPVAEALTKPYVKGERYTGSDQ